MATKHLSREELIELCSQQRLVVRRTKRILLNYQKLAKATGSELDDLIATNAIKKLNKHIRGWA